jgi:hypothetical protein
MSLSHGKLCGPMSAPFHARIRSGAASGFFGRVTTRPAPLELPPGVSGADYRPFFGQVRGKSTQRLTNSLTHDLNTFVSRPSRNKRGETIYWISIARAPETNSMERSRKDSKSNSLCGCRLKMVPDDPNEC